MRKNPRDFVIEATAEPYELDLETAPAGGPMFVTFTSPTKMETGSAFDIARSQDAEEIAKALLSPEEYKLWWAEWERRPLDETMKLLEDVQKHYGADPGKSGS